MRTLVASAVYVSLATGIFAQQPNGDDFAARDKFNGRSRLVNSYRNSGDYNSAERVLREWIPSEPAGSVSRMKVQNALADLLREEGRNAEARRLFAEVAGSPGVPWQQRLNALMGLADADLHGGDPKTAIDEWNETLEIARAHDDKESEVVILRGLGRTWLTAGSAARAEPLLRQSLHLAETGTKAAPLELAGSLTAMGEYYLADHKLALAEDHLSRALAIERTIFGDVHPQVNILMEMLAEVLSERGDKDLACDYATRAAEAMSQWFGDSSPAAATALANLASVEQRSNTLGAAASHYETAIRVLRNFPELRQMLSVVMQRYAGVLKAMHRDQEAKALDTEAKAFRPN